MKISKNGPRILRKWKTLSKKTLLNLGSFLTVEKHELQLPDGKIIPDWSWIITPDIVLVVAVNEKQDFLCIRQTKYAIRGIALAPVGGMIEPGEEPLNAAKRELLEETGFSSEKWIRLGSYVLDPNHGIATVNLFMALDIKKVAEPDELQKDLEDQQIVFLSLKETHSALREGRFKTVQWSAAVALALDHLA